MTPTKDKESIWSVAFISLLAINFFQAMSVQIGNTVIPLYARDLGVTAATIGIIVASFAITALAVRPFSGPAFDSFPKKPLFLAAYALNMIAMFLYSTATTPEALFMVRLLHGIGIGCAEPLGMAICNQILPASHLSSGISIYMLAFTVAQSVGPAFAIWFAQTTSYQTSFVVSGVLLAASLVLIITLKVPEQENRPPYKIRFDRIFAKPAFITGAILFLLSTAFSATNSFLIIYGMACGVGNIGLYFTVYAICMLFTRPVFGKLSDKHGTTVILVPAILCFALSYVIISQARDLPMFLLAAVIGACGYGVCSPLIQALTFRIVPPDRSGAGSNTTYTGLDLGNLVGPSLAGGLVDLFVPLTGSQVSAFSCMWLLLIVPIMAGMVFYLVMRPRIERYRRQAHLSWKRDARDAIARRRAAEQAKRDAQRAEAHAIEHVHQAELDARNAMQEMLAIQVEMEHLKVRLKQARVRVRETEAEVKHAHEEAQDAQTEMHEAEQDVVEMQKDGGE